MNRVNSRLVGDVNEVNTGAGSRRRQRGRERAGETEHGQQKSGEKHAAERHVAW
jgi:hypothetical protein